MVRVGFEFVLATRVALCKANGFPGNNWRAEGGLLNILTDRERLDGLIECLLFARSLECCNNVRATVKSLDVLIDELRELGLVNIGMSFNLGVDVSVTQGGLNVGGRDYRSGRLSERIKGFIYFASTKVKTGRNRVEPSYPVLVSHN